MDNFIRELNSACLQAFHELHEVGQTEYQNFDVYFESFSSDDNQPALQTKLSESTQLPESTTLIEREITNRLLEQPTSQLNGKVLTLGPAGGDSGNQSSQQWVSCSSPPPIISILLAIKYIAEL